MSKKTQYIFLDPGYELTGVGSITTTRDEETDRAEVIVEIDGTTVKDHGNGVIVHIGRRKPIALDYAQLADIFRCVRMMDMESKRNGYFPLDLSEAYRKEQ